MKSFLLPLDSFLIERMRASHRQEASSSEIGSQSVCSQWSCHHNNTCPHTTRQLFSVWCLDEWAGMSPLAQKETKSWAGPYLSGCWETHAQERWRVCGRRSRAFVDPSQWLKMRLQSDTVTIHPAKDSILLLTREGRVMLHLLTLQSSRRLNLQSISAGVRRDYRAPHITKP